MNSTIDYWKECISIAADECDLSLTKEQLDCLASSVEGGHDNYGMAFYSPPASDRIDDMRRQYEERNMQLQKEFDQYRRNSEEAIKRSLKIGEGYQVSIESHGDVFVHGGRTVQVQ